ncbi:MAG TPA: isochorismatase family cysteine hydrolase [Polyangia bacterium]|nr:isochorismatase family cysteine hydrolase [Polyangia bacterium]
MAKRVASAGLSGEADDRCSVALLLIDVINDLEWPRGDVVRRAALPMARRLAALKRRAARARVPSIYVNDNFGRWKSNFNATVEHCLHDDVRGRFLAEQLAPQKDDYFVLKPMHSGFYGTSLELLLEHLGVDTVVLAGIAGNNCVLFTANDAYMRGYRLIVPSDTVVSNTPRQNRAGLAQMRAILKATTPPAASVRFEQLVTRRPRGAGKGLARP